MRTHNIQKFPDCFNNIRILEKKLKKESEEYWVRRGERSVINLFRLMSKRVPAYRDFLQKNRINASLIETVKDLKKVPPIDKLNYLKKYPLEMMCWDGKLVNKRWTFAVNSGSTGDTYYFPRELEQDWQYATMAELYLRNIFEIQKKSTLYIDCFAMGAWIGGLFTYEAIRLLAERAKYKISIFAPGIFKDEILKAIINLGPKFDLIIIGGYPPFVKDIIDSGVNSGLNWKKYNLKFIFSAEAFTENFRDYVFKKTGTEDVYRSSLNHYGTADMGTMAHETPLSILIRRLAVKNNKLYNKLFSAIRTPTFAQYIPELFYFENVNGQLYCSGYSGLPLIRYDLKDVGGVISMSDVTDIMCSEDISINDEIINAGLFSTVWNLPFVYVYERSDFVVKLYGANIFPDTIRRVLQQKRFERIFSGKFAMLTQYDKNEDQFLEINIELKLNVKTSKVVTKLVEEKIVEKLLLENSEYKSNYKSDPLRQIPKIVLWEYEDPTYFTPGIKQRWVKKQ